MYIVQCVNKEYLDPYYVSRQSQIEAGVPYEHLLFSYDDLPVDHIKIEEPAWQNVTEFSDVEMKGMVLRLAAFDWLKANGFDRVLYIDCDTIIQGDLSELEHVNIKGNWLAAASENHCKYYDKSIYKHRYPQEEQRRFELNPEYFNSGVLLLDLQKCPVQSFVDGFGLELDRYLLPDQDYLNSLAIPYARMPRTYNCVPEMRVADLLETQHLVDLHRELLGADIIHFAARIKPYTENKLDYYGLQIPYERYYEYAQRTEGVSQGFLDIIKGNVDLFKSTINCIRPFL
ncbi:glycosyltransferase [Salinivibrio sp. KP-1]|uniref:glycosyltransferase family 8 protein n=1 Tax=Salinivibrio sp. KP-1 TaxID=1406902 RepID=UPI0006148B4C|nr:glycosyltransferase [Salinivibrio sp. KP-1]KKA43429.1 hypothetical protein WN56_13660 [Salinivibrio sp. KP-1]